MLIDKGITPGEVVSLKLISGQELLGKLVEETTTMYKISKPLVLSMSQQGIGMIPFMFTVDPEKEISISKSAIIVIANCDKQFADQYISGTTGIAMR